MKSLAEGLLKGTLEPAACARALSKLDEVDRATVVESFESATRTRPELVDGNLFNKLVECLADSAPRVRWEAARTIANTAAQHPTHLGRAAQALLANTTHAGKVVRWATAQALAAILRAGHTDDDLEARVRKASTSEQDNGVRAIYDKALRRKR